MSKWPATKARRVLAALLRIGWSVKRRCGGSRRVLERVSWPDCVFAFHDDDEIGPRMLARIARASFVQHAEKPAVFGTPEPDRAVGAGGRQEMAVRAYGHRMHRLLMAGPWQAGMQLGLVGVPQTNLVGRKDRARRVAPPDPDSPSHSRGSCPTGPASVPCHLLAAESVLAYSSGA